jgi:pimeloyl-ACP methyl ester carboxylesterase
MKYLELHGDRVAYREAGAGEALLLIHGMAGSSATWRAVLAQLSKKYRVVAPDLLGHGESAKPRGDYSLGAFAVWLRDLLDELGITRATVVGQSLGGGVAMQFTYQHRDYCERLVLISSGGLGPDLSWILRMLSAPGVELVLPVVAPRPVLNVGKTLGSWLTSAGIHSPRAEIWNAYSSLSDGQTRQAFLRTALGGGLPRPGGQCDQPVASEFWLTDLADLGGSGSDHPCRPRLRRSRRRAG